MKTEQECLEYLKDINTPVLTTVQCETCEGKLSLNEIYAALESMPSNKSPGNDRLSKEFYLCFFDTIGSIHNFIAAILIKLGFGPNFVQWVKTLLYKQESCTGFCSCTRGSRQGDPLSAFYSFYL